jgi:hypothetical protein
MTTATTKVKNGAIELPRPLKRNWRNAEVFLHFSGDTLVVRKEETVRSPKEFKTFKPTKAEVMALKRARENYKKGNFMTLNEFERKLGFKS